ncbi:MAG: ATP phosphoribosyltransferase regulatory subunit [Glaciimonas sp.]|nr:ATP phosphoribosyltransferase regulatory subunit [Glaciimonas sp.]
MPNWLLPENIADVLTSEACKIENLRRLILDNFRVYGYKLVMPPMLEYTESLLAGAGQDTDAMTFKLVDQLSGRTLGIRTDMTTQVVRIDAHLLNRLSLTRLCYAGSVLRTRPSGLHAIRESFQIGTEIYGYAGLEADAEIQHLALASLALAGITEVRLDLCHVGIFRAIIAEDDFMIEDEVALVKLLEAKDIPGLQKMSVGYAAETRTALLALPYLYGDVSVIALARRVLPKLPLITKALKELQALAHVAGEECVTVDLADLRGYHYKSGAIFGAYVSGLPNALVRGARYDHVGETFGRSRPATGFSMDLRELVRLMPSLKRKAAIRAPWNMETDLKEKIVGLRKAGEIVIQSLPGHENDQDEFDCDRAVVLENGNWIIKNLD